jgi:hypothetical protein
VEIDREDIVKYSELAPGDWLIESKILNFKTMLYWYFIFARFDDEICSFDERGRIVRWSNIDMKIDGWKVIKNEKRSV